MGHENSINLVHYFQQVVDVLANRWLSANFTWTSVIVSQHPIGWGRDAAIDGLAADKSQFVPRMAHGNLGGHLNLHKGRLERLAGMGFDLFHSLV